MKRRILRISAFVLLVLTAFTLAGCKKQVVPEISNPNGAYATVGSYQVTNREIYFRAKSNYGLEAILEEIDTKLLASYLNQVTDERIDELIEESKFGNIDKTTLPVEDVEKYEQEFIDEHVVQGRHNEELIRKYYALNEARRLYALEKFTEYVNNYKGEDDEPYFKESELEAYYKNNYKADVQAIVVTFITEYEARKALEALNIKVDRTGLKWVTRDTEVELTPAEVYAAFINLYNNYNGYYRVGDGNIIEAGDYEIDNGKFVFKNDFLEEVKDEKHIKFVYKYSDYSSSHIITQKLFTDLKAYQPTLDDDTDKTLYTDHLHQSYTPTPAASGTSKFHLVLKVGYGETKEYEDVKDEIKTELIKNRLTATEIDNQLLKLRQDAKVTLHDYYLNNAYQQLVDANYKAPKKLSKTAVATYKVNDETIEITADQLFAKLSKQYGGLLISDLLDREALIHDPKYNDVYDFTNNKVKDKSKYSKLEDLVDQYREDLENDVYASRGFDKNYGWKEFIRDAYGLTDEKDLALKVALFDYAIEKFINESYTKEDIRKEMLRIKDEFFEANIIGINIFVDYDNNNSPDRHHFKEADTHLSNWNAQQIGLAKNLINLIREKIAEYIDPKLDQPDYATGFGRLIQDYNNASLDDEVWGVYKRNGLRIQFENLGSISNTSTHVQELKDEVQKLWKLVPMADRGKAIYPKIVVGEEDPNYWSDIFASNTGFRYIGITRASDYVYAKKTDGRVLPNDEEIEKYLEDPNTPDLTSAVKSSIERYYVTAVNTLQGFSYAKTGRVNRLLHDYTVSKGITFTESTVLEVFNKIHDIFDRNKTYTPPVTE